MTVCFLRLELPSQQENRRTYIANIVEGALSNFYHATIRRKHLSSCVRSAD